MLRCLLVVLLLPSVLCLHAQDWDVYISGVLSDAATRAPIPFAEVRVTDQLSAEFTGHLQVGANGHFLRELYSGWSAPGGRYVLEFMAEGYRSRTAMIDVSEVKKADKAIAWEILIDVPLERAEGDDKRGKPVGTCRWHEGSGTLRWVEERAAKSFPVRQYRDERIAAHSGAVDSVYALSGLMLDGSVRDHWTDVPIGGVEVHVTTVPPDSMKEMHYTTDRYGYYLMALPYGPVYAIGFGKEGLVHKRVEVDTRQLAKMPPSTTGFRAVLDIRLFPELPGEDLAFLNEPIGRMFYEQAGNEMAWDMAYSRPLLERLDRILARHRPK
jgi:hypothetical protein